MVNKKKRYVGTVTNELEAAQLYDKTAIQFHGKKVTEFLTFRREPILTTRNFKY
jgi:hypothetical protein